MKVYIDNYHDLNIFEGFHLTLGPALNELSKAIELPKTTIEDILRVQKEAAYLQTLLASYYHSDTKPRTKQLPKRTKPKPKGRKYV